MNETHNLDLFCQTKRKRCSRIKAGILNRLTLQIKITFLCKGLLNWLDPGASPMMATGMGFLLKAMPQDDTV